MLVAVRLCNVFKGGAKDKRNQSLLFTFSSVPTLLILVFRPVHGFDR